MALQPLFISGWKQLSAYMNWGKTAQYLFICGFCKL